jgi:protease-4
MRRALLALTALWTSGCFNGLLLMPTHVGTPVEEVVVAKPDRCICLDKIALIDVEGMILNAKTSSLLMGDGENPMALFRERLDQAAEDKRVKAVVIRINSPGGAVTASDIMYQDLVRFRHKTQKPVVACMMDVCASGGYYLAMGCDCVIAHPSTVTGSIGVIMSLYNASGLAHLLGIKSEPIKSGPNKDLGNPLRDMTEQERAILQMMVNSFYDQFVHVVCEGRHLPEERVRELADGRIYTGLDAARLGLVDRVGYLDDALDVARDLAHICDAKVVAYDRCGGYRGSIYAAMPHIPSELKIKLDVPGVTGTTGAGFLYLWEPGVRH